jgi:hypothetical protein
MRVDAKVHGHHFAQDEWGGRGEPTGFFPCRYAYHPPGGLQVQALRGVSFQGRNVDLETQGSPNWRYGVAGYKHTCNADVTGSANTCLVFPAKNDGDRQLEADSPSLLHRPPMSIRSQDFRIEGVLQVEFHLRLRIIAKVCLSAR